MTKSIKILHIFLEKVEILENLEFLKTIFIFVKNKKMNRDLHIENFIKDCIGDCSILQYSISVNEDTLEQLICEIKITNTVNDNKVFMLLHCNDAGQISVMKGDEFRPTTEKDFLTELFLSQFITCVEETKKQLVN